MEESSLVLETAGVTEVFVTAMGDAVGVVVALVVELAPEPIERVT